MIKTVPIRTIARPAVAAACALLAACTSYSAPVPAVQAIPPGPTPDEVANYSTAQMQYRYGLATGNGDAVAKANETFRQIPREIFSRQDPKLFEAEVICERYRVARPTATGRSVSTLIEQQCQNIKWRYNEATNAIRQDLEARIATADFATIAQAGATHP
jgi:hypothetical protein